jgi:hypothetical protein
LEVIGDARMQRVVKVLCSAERLPINVLWMPYAFSCFNHTSALPALIEILTSNNV